MDASQEMPKKKVLPPMMLSVLIGVVGILVVVLCGVANPAKQMDFSAGSQIAPAQAEEAFLESDSNQDLYDLLVSLCYQNQQEPGSADTLLMQYGTELYDRAKAGDLDLETIGDPELTLDMLSCLKKLGIQP